ncbi:MAG TPA: 50S ribosomal protein L25 [Longimicrobiaceae bacterium]|nr:50S ribosomal protein L25 [Longimicrobiaceae bacterium]
MANATLKANRRDGHGKGVARKLRGTGRVPAVLYGHGDRTESLSIDAHELELLLHSINAENTIIGLDVDGSRADVLIREIQKHPFKPEVLHVDFLLVHGDEVLRLQIPVRLVGTPVGVLEDDGVLDQVIYDLEVDCLPRHIPEAAEVDISALRVGESVRVRDVSIPDVTILTDGDLAIASLLHPTVPTEEPEEEAAAAPEPELVRDRRGEDEE